MKLLLVHLSDIHIKSDGDFILKRADQISRALTNLEDGIEGCIVVLTGDVAYSGQPGEYALAERFLIQLRACLIKTVGVADVPIVIVPGNHDCDFSTENQVRDILIGTVTKGAVTKGAVTKISDELVRQSILVQSHYWQFVSRIKGTAVPTSPKVQLCSVEPVQIGNKKISFHAYNTAWMSQKHEIQASLIYPIEYLPAEDTSSDLVVAMFHHPYNWLDSTNARLFSTNIERMADLILTGHEHEPGQYLKSNRITGITNEYFEGDVLQDSTNHDSAFNAILIDLDAKKQKFIQCHWDGKLYATEALQATWQDFQRNKNRIRNEFVVSQEITDFLTNPGAGFTNSRKEKLELNDIFVEPNVKELIRIDTGSQVVQLPIRGERFWHRLLDNPYVAILGGESSGKTTLAKNLFNRFHAAGFVPVLFHGNEIKSCDRDRLVKDIANAVEHQYSAGVVERFRQMGADKLVLLIDNYHHIQLNNKGSQELFKHLRQLFGRIVLFTHDLSKLDELPLEEGIQNPLSSFIQFEMQEFGNQLREELIEMWFTIGQEFSLSDADLETQVVNTKRVVDSVLGRNLLPSYPIFILIVLQQIEAQSNLTTGSGSLGYLYEHLITSSLAKTAKRLALDTAHTYLSEIAQQMFVLGVRRLNEAQMNTVHEQYCADYKMTLRFDAIEKALIDAELLTVVDGRYSFKYKYCYYYFAARHLRDRLSSDDGKAQLRRLAEHIYKEEFANILIFLTYLSKEPIIIEEMLRAARAVYPDAEPCDFSGQMTFVASLHDQIPKSVLIDQDTKSARREMNEAIDKIEAEMKQPNEDADLNDALRINVAFKTIQILGQLLKNFSGSIKGDAKLEVAEECYFLGLRALRTLFTVLEPHTEDIVGFISQQIEKFENDPVERRKKARKFVSLLVEGIALSFVKKISGSVGTESLRPIYEELVAKHKTLSVRLIDLSVKLDHFQKFPEDEFDILIDEVATKNLFGTLILRHLAFDHFYRYPTLRTIKQKYCSKLGIEIKTINLLEYKRSST
ncbi:MAG: metallophosphoesterase family protein [Sulfuricella sp.]